MKPLFLAAALLALSGCAPVAYMPPPVRSYHTPPPPVVYTPPPVIRFRLGHGVHGHWHHRHHHDHHKGHRWIPVR